MKSIFFIKLLILLAFIPMAAMAKSAKLLPVGESQLSLQYGRVQIENNFNGFAHSESLNYRRPVTWGEFIGGGMPLSSGATPELLPIDAIVGFVSPSLQSSESRYLPVTKFGLTSIWTLQLSLPFVQNNYQSKQQFKANEKLRKILAQLPEAIAAYNKQIAQVESGRDTRLGDLELLNRFAMIESFNFNANFLAGITLPATKLGTNSTGIIFDPEEGQIDYSIGTELEFFHTAVLTTEFNVRYTIQTNDNIEVYEQLDDGYIIGEIQRDVGDRLNWSLIAKLKLTDGLALSGFYELENKKSDSYSDSYYFKNVGEQIGPTNRINHVVGSGLTFKSYSLSNKNSLPNPYFISINYSQSVAGENVLQNKNLGLALGMLL